MSAPRRGEIYYLPFVPGGPAELSGPHPALVLQNDVGNRASQLTIVAGITTNLRAAQLPVGVRIEPEESGVARTSVIHLGRIYTVDRSRLERRLGRLSAKKMGEVEAALQVSLGLARFTTQGDGRHRPN